jgi:hypothetical protein
MTALQTIGLIFYIMGIIVVGAMVFVSMYSDIKGSVIYIIEWIKNKRNGTGNNRHSH